MHDQFGRSSIIAILLAGLLLPVLARADNIAGTTAGVVLDRTADYVLIRPSGDAPRRYWLSDSDTAATRPDRTMLAAFASLRAGDEVTATWTQGDRRRITAIRLIRHAPPPATTRAFVPPAVAVFPTSMPSTRPLEVTTDGRSTTGEAVNAAIDNLLAVGRRLLELPLWMLLTAVIVVGGLLFTAARALDRIGRPATAGRLRVAIYCVGVVFVAFLLDRKIVGLQNEVSALAGRLNDDALKRLGAAPAAARVGRPLLFDAAAAEKSLAEHFNGVKLTASVYNPAADVVRISVANPLVQAYLAVIDLTNLTVAIKLGTTLDQKRLTSAFAKENDCTIAINGEAGQSPATNSGLGVWRGNLVYGGQILSREDPAIPRPFLGFDAKNRATLTPAAAKDRTLPAGMPTVIWGRLDAIVAGVVQTADERFRQPRTAMGISQDGARLFLLVVDGRQPGFSTGVTRAEVGYLLAAFGAYHAMLCDEGGSSCMYLRDLGGIANVPSDNHGEERPTYTHFGITVRADGRQ